MVSHILWVVYNICMKKVVSFIFVVGVIYVAAFLAIKYINYPDDSPVLGTESTAVSNRTAPETQVLLDHDGSNYTIAWIKVDANRVSLVPNFSEMKTAKTVQREMNCKTVVNGGFYFAIDSENVPIGLFISDGNEISEYRQNSLFDGILSVNEFGTPRITAETPDDALLVAVQTGPMLQSNNFEHELSMTRDKKARRMVAAVTGDNELIFISVYDPETTFFGPLLADLPEIISMFEESENINIADAINLDGGAASAFYSDGIALSEASPVGSFFCVE